MNQNMRTSWTKLSGLILFAATVAYGCSSDSNTTTPPAEAGAKCGNGTIDTGEDCDGTKLNSKTCKDVSMSTFTGGTLKCSATTCKFDTSSCTKAMTGTGGGTGTGGAPVGNGGSPGTGGKKNLDGGTDSGAGGTGTGGTTGTGGSSDAGSKKTDAGDAKAPLP
jgi:hypothetical protein